MYKGILWSDYLFCLHIVCLHGIMIRSCLGIMVYSGLIFFSFELVILHFQFLAENKFVFRTIFWGGGESFSHWSF